MVTGIAVRVRKHRCRDKNLPSAIGEKRALTNGSKSLLREYGILRTLIAMPSNEGNEPKRELANCQFSAYGFLKSYNTDWFDEKCNERKYTYKQNVRHGETLNENFRHRTWIQLVVRHSQHSKTQLQLSPQPEASRPSVCCPLQAQASTKWQKVIRAFSSNSIRIFPIFRLLKSLNTRKSERGRNMFCLFSSKSICTDFLWFESHCKR